MKGLICSVESVKRTVLFTSSTQRFVAIFRFVSVAFYFVCHFHSCYYSLVNAISFMLQLKEVYGIEYKAREKSWGKLFWKNSLSEGLEVLGPQNPLLS